MYVKLNLTKNGSTRTYSLSYIKDQTKTNDDNLNITRGKVFNSYASNVGITSSQTRSSQLTAMKNSARRYYSNL